MPDPSPSNADSLKLQLLTARKKIVLFSTDNRGNARDVVTRVGTVTEKSASEKIRIFYERTTLLSAAAETKRVRFQLFF